MTLYQFIRCHDVVIKYNQNYHLWTIRQKTHLSTSSIILPACFEAMLSRISSISAINSLTDFLGAGSPGWPVARTATPRVLRDTQRKELIGVVMLSMRGAHAKVRTGKMHRNRPSVESERHVGEGLALGIVLIRGVTPASNFWHA